VTDKPAMSDKYTEKLWLTNTLGRFNVTDKPAIS